jgi:branched-chain amino acid transport system substrate-binding protein
VGDASGFRLIGMLLPGITAETSPSDFAQIEEMQTGRFTGDTWQLFGPVISGDLGGM